MAKVCDRVTSKPAAYIYLFNGKRKDMFYLKNYSSTGLSNISGGRGKHILIAIRIVQDFKQRTLNLEH